MAETTATPLIPAPSSTSIFPAFNPPIATAGIGTFLPKFEIYKNGSYIGCLSKEFSFLTPHYNIDYNGWHIDGTIMEWDYSILNQNGYSIARVSKELFHMTDTYVIDVQDPGNALDALMFVLAIDAEKCSRN